MAKYIKKLTLSLICSFWPTVKRNSYSISLEDCLQMNFFFYICTCIIKYNPV